MTREGGIYRAKFPPNKRYSARERTIKPLSAEVFFGAHRLRYPRREALYL